ncbi:hypothetical protein [Xenophilus sp. Marseille-Q4582]|uniref:hypothetical protein n=1 Tax=Xenophilus sp. Marseille-Q4582 TaxID=2866600 RepID=UPI001CE45BD3|nr:hypothetical protein [Xenophilus sp. Marseille-Q4582]
MSIEQLRAISQEDLPLIVEDLNEVLGVRSLIEGGLVVGYAGVLDFLPCGRAVVVRPAVIRDVTAMGAQFLGLPDPRLPPHLDLFD